VFGPSTIELRPLFLAEHKCGVTFRVGKALPKSDRKFGSIAGWKS
jgi:hypothetical protein